MSPRTAKTFVIVLALAAAGGYGAWLWLRSYANGAGRYTDGDAVYADTSGELVRHAVWGPAQALAASVNSPASEARPALSPDGRFLVFAVGERGLNTNLYRAEIVNGEPRDPELIASIDTSADETAPAFSATHLYFASDRAGGAGGLDLWRARYDDGEFEQVERLDASLQSAQDDCDPAPTADDSVVLFASNRAGSFDLYSAERAHERERSEPESAVVHAGDRAAWIVQAIDDVNTKHAEREPALAADGRALFFASDRPDSAGSFDLFRSALAADGWCPPVALAGLNTSLCERGPAPSSDGFAMYFARGDDESSLDLYRARSLELYRVPPVAISWIDIAILASLLALALMAALAQQYGQLDFIYKCFLVSVLVHILLLLWMRYVYMEGYQGSSEVEARHRVRVISSDRAPIAEHVERAGAVELQRSPRATGPVEITKAEIGTADREATPRELASAELSPAPDPVSDAASRGRDFAPPSDATRTDVALQDVTSDVEQRVASAPELGLSAARLEAPRTVASSSAPSRLAIPGSTATSPRPEAWTPVAPDASTGPGSIAEASERRASATSGFDPRSTTAPVRVGVASPQEETQRNDAPAPALALAPTDARASGAGVGRGRDGSSAPERQSSFGSPSAGSRGSALPKSSVVQDIGASPAPDAPPSRIGGDALGPQAADGARVALEDRETVERLGGGSSSSNGANGANAGTGDREFLSSLAPPAGAISRASTGGAPERISPSGSPSASGRGSVAPKAAVVGDIGAPPAPAASPSRGAQDSVNPGAGEAPRVALEDREAVERRGSGGSGGSGGAGTTGTNGGAGGGDFLASVAPREGAIGRTGSGGAPGQWNRATAPAAIEAPALAPAAVELPERAPDAQRPTRSTWEDTPYQNRAGEEKARALELHGGSKETEEAVARGLAYLARIAKPRGHWGDLRIADEKYGQIAVGKTGLALLAFLGAGHTQSSGTEYSALVARTIAFLLSIQEEESGHFGDSSAYCHGIATYALAECLALTHDESLRPALERAVAHILSHQSHRNDPRFFGGWGYYYTDDRTFDPWPRTSITAWQVMALESARLSGLTVPDQAFADARTFLQNARDEDGGFVRYNHDPERLNSGYPTLPASTPAGLFALSLVGEDITSAPYRPLITFVLNRVPRSYRYTGDDDFVSRAQGNSYFWYYATLSMFRAGGRAWEAWNEAMKQVLLPAQQSDGSWKPIDIYARYAHDDSSDRSYTTSMCVLSLEVYYRYYLPLLRVR